MKNILNLKGIEGVQKLNKSIIENKDMSNAQTHSNK